MKFLILIYLFATLTSCNLNSQVYELSGYIDDDEVKKLYVNSSSNIILINSYGGEVESAGIIAEIIRNRELSVIIEGLCISACADFF